MIHHPFDPIIDAHSKVLILGSFPSIASFEEGFYYGHPRNQFWKLMEALFSVNLDGIEQKTRFLHDHHIALWDLYGALTREQGNSSDANLSNTRPNPIDTLLGKHPSITTVFCNGNTSYKGFLKHFGTLHVKHFLLPSSSPAYAAKSFAAKLEAYRSIRSVLEAD